MPLVTRFLCALVLGRFSCAGAERGVVEVGVVTTFGDLAMQPAIELEDGVTIRVGLQARTIPLGSAVAFVV